MPSAKLALFFCKNACSLEDGHDEHYYYDKGLGAAEKDPTMRFTRFPRVEQPSPPSARRVAAAKRAVQAEKDRYPLFPELVRYATTESRLDAMQSTVSRGGNSTAITSPQAGVKPELPSDHYRPAPAPGSSVTGKPAHCQVTPVYLLGMLHDHRARKRCFWHALAELRRLKLISAGRLPNPWKRS